MISIIIPTFNSADTIVRAIRSVIAQRDVENFEIIVVDDASTDNTLEEVSSLELDMLHLISLNCNVGAGQARNYGLDVAKGDYIAFLDADDFWLPGKLSKQLALFVAHEDVSIISSGLAYINMNLRTKKRHVIRSTEGIISYQTRSQLLYKNRLSTSTVICRRSAIGDNRFTNMRRRQDWVFWWDLVQSNNTILLHPDITAVYDLGTKGLSSSFFKARYSDFVAIKKMTSSFAISIIFFSLMIFEKITSKFLRASYTSKAFSLDIIRYKGELEDD